MSHPLVLGLFDDLNTASAAGRALREMGIFGSRLSVVAATHEQEGVLARALGASPGAEIEDSRPAARLGELSAHVIAAVAIVLPGVGPLLAAGPLAAEFGEAAGHVAGGVAAVLRNAGVDEARAVMWQERIEGGAVLLGAHVVEGDTEPVVQVLLRSGARETALAEWQ